jgi:hypothetical protein
MFYRKSFQAVLIVEFSFILDKCIILLSHGDTCLIIGPVFVFLEADKAESLNFKDQFIIPAPPTPYIGDTVVDKSLKAAKYDRTKKVILVH